MLNELSEDRMLRRFAFLGLTLALAVGCAPTVSTGGVAQAPTVDRVVFMAGFRPQANLPFVAAYVAKERGLFREQNLDVEIQHSAGQGEHVRLVIAQQVLVSTATGANVINLVAESNAPLVSIALFGQRSDQAFAVPVNSPIRHPRDFEGRVVGFRGQPSAEYLAMLRATGVDRNRITEVNVGFDPRILTTGQVDVLPVFRANEPNVLRRLGFETRLISPEDYNVPTLGLTYFTSREQLERQRPQLVRFLRATSQATEWIIQNPEAALDIVMKYAPNEDRDLQRELLRSEIEGAQSPVVQRDGLLALNLERWREVSAQMAQTGVINRSVAIEQLADDSPRREAQGRR
ncbi:MAG: ABC transporter substrate-binding protein [Dehalococcoidia bacterium]|nr:ABC transporter substrate-binding protein [Dehalococcoidia bacterium]